jgi:hypothetical protein
MLTEQGIQEAGQATSAVCAYALVTHFAPLLLLLLLCYIPIRPSLLR